MAKNSLKIVLTNQIKIVDIAAEFEIPLESIGGGKFDYRCKCPAQNHKSGTEKTPSLYIDSQNNNYYCFGCQSSFNSIDFYMICSGFSFSEALAELKTRINDHDVVYSDTPASDNLPIILEISNLFRNTILSHRDDLVWINNLMKQTDEYLSDFKKEDGKKAKKLLSVLKEKINERYK